MPEKYELQIAKNLTTGAGSGDPQVVDAGTNDTLVQVTKPLGKTPTSIGISGPRQAVDTGADGKRGHSSVSLSSAHACNNNDCRWTSSGCRPVQANSNMTCKHRYKFGDFTLSQSCRCAGVGGLVSEYGSVENAFATFSANTSYMDFSDFQRLISTFRNSVPNYTVSWEFRRADKNQDGKISMAEFLQSAAYHGGIQGR
jgi:hypothetical protein